MQSAAASAISPVLTRSSPLLREHQPQLRASPQLYPPTQAWSTGAVTADGAPLATVTEASAPSDTPTLEEPLELLWSGDDDVAHGNHSRPKFPLHVLTKCAAQPL